MSDGFARRKEHSKHEIRRAALELFSQFGVERVSVVDIAERAGVSQATIYNNFGSKEALVLEFVKIAIDQLVTQAEAALAPPLPFREKVSAFLLFIARMLSQGGANAAGGRVFAGSSDLLNDPEIRKIHAAAREKMADVMLGLVRDGREQGQISPGISDETYRLFFKNFTDIYIDEDFRQRHEQNPAILQEMGSLLIFGLSGPRQP